MYKDNVTTKDRLREQLTKGNNPWLENIKVDALKYLGRGKQFWPQIVIKQEKDENVIIHDDSFIVPVVVHCNSFGLTSRSNFLLTKQSYDSRILGIKSCMPGGRAQGEYQRKNVKVIQKLSFSCLFKKEQAIIEMMINRAVESDKSDGYIKPLGCECIANRDFHLFLCGEKFTFEWDDIIKTIEVRSGIFNCIQDNDPGKDKFHWVGKISEKKITKVYDELRGSFS